ncbi:hypothetical protein QVD17_26646 [Tagetes erecta]|uniref:Cyclin D3 n=1 Tax=Tagetes erecta TaxID=13708 RepID=A0AAD8K7A4_TARER|nr:hypothetical protein QVD17_26646 [Tagetes erecta]
MAISSPSSASFYYEHQHHPLSQDINDDEQLVSLFTKEQLQTLLTCTFDDPSARKQAVEWILKVKSHFGFTHLTAIVAINYVDRFVSSFCFQEPCPWMMQLLAVTCLSLAAKLEQTQVPSLLDLQVDDTNYLFHPKNIQKMELLVMTTLNWNMNPITPISFLVHIITRLGLNTHLHRDFVDKCEDLILFLVSDSRFVGYKPSVVATAAMLHVLDQQVDFFNHVDYQKQLLEAFKTTKEKVKECNKMIVEVSHSSSFNLKKRKFEENEIISSSAPSSSSYRSSSEHHHGQPLVKKPAITIP